MTAEFENHVKKLQERLRGLPAGSVAAFSAACAERLIVFYELFTIQNAWECYPKVRNALDLCWEVLNGQSNFKRELEDFSAQLLVYVPHADDFSGILCLGAQDFAACLESAINWITDAPKARYGAVFYPLEVLHAAAMLARTGNLSVNVVNSRSEEAFLMEDPAISKEFSTQANILEILEKDPWITKQHIDAIRAIAVQNRLSLRL